MQYFFNKVIKPYIIGSKYTEVCEIGAESGGNTDKLLSINSIRLSVIDPCLTADLCNKYEKNKMVRVYKGLSLEVLPKVSQQFDCFLIDGDHNWYTVYNELKTIYVRSLLKKGGTIFFHDVCWPYGRRDMYYMPESIPEEFRHSHAKQGIECGKSSLSEASTFNESFNNAIYEGGPRNGVLTAIEDFLKEYKKEYLFFVLDTQCGLGVLIKKKGIITRIRSFKWLSKVKYYEYLTKVAYFVRIKSPFTYRLCIRIARMFNIRIWD